MGAIDKHRKAAMHIHCLTENDKHWVLSRLDRNDSQAIREHLNTLADMEVPKDPKFINAAIEALDEKSEKELYEILNRSVLSDLESVVDVFESEPAWVGACLRLEYPGLVENYIVPKLSKITLHEIDKYTKNNSFTFAAKMKIAVFDVVASHFRKNVSHVNERNDVLSFESALKQAV